MADECVQIGDVLHCRCGNPSSHYGTMGLRGAREVREQIAHVEKERFCWEQAFQRVSDEMVEQAANARAGAAAIRVLEAEVSRLAAENERLREWRNSVSNAVKNIPEFHSGEWAGDKEGWGFHFEVIRWLQRERIQQAVIIERLMAAMALVPVKHLNTLADFLDMEQSAGRWGAPGSTEVQDDIRKLAAAARELGHEAAKKGASDAP